MDDHPVTIRPARPDDAASVARVFIESWHDTYAGVLPSPLLCAMTLQGQTARWRATVRAKGRERVCVAEHARYGIVGMTSFGPARDGAGAYDGEVYTLYVDPSFLGRGAGRALMCSAFEELRRRGYTSCIVWAHAKNPARFFYEAMGGKLAAHRLARLMGDGVPEAAYGWPRLSLRERTAATKF